MTDRLLLLRESDQKFLRRVLDIWQTVMVGDSEGHEKAAHKAGMLRQIDGKYTEAERIDMFELALQLAPYEGEGEPG